MNDRRRVVRALELVAIGATLSPAGDRLWSEETRRPTVVVGLELPEGASALDAVYCAAQPKEFPCKCAFLRGKQINTGEPTCLL
jgi:hypothetical protein